MPTGYTAKLYEGEQEFEDFVRTAARGMGAFVHLRDDPWTEPLTYPQDRSPQALGGLKQAMRANTRWRMSSEEDKYRWWSAYVEETERSIEEADNSEFYARRDRFDAMTERVKNTSVPEKLETFKTFMLEQLGTEFQYRREPWVREILSYPEWCESERAYRQRTEDVRRETYHNARERYLEVCEYINLLADTFGFEVEK